MRKIERNEEAVSPVIGVILMVAITVILAAVIAAFVFGMAGTTTTKNVALTVSIGKTTAATPVATGVITVQGGADLKTLTLLQYALNGGAKADVVQMDATAVPNSGTAGYLKVGDLLTIGANDPTNKRITLTATFADGSSQIVFDKTM